MKKKELINKIENAGKYCKVRIDRANNVTGMLVDEDYRYKPHTNTGGRRYIGNANDPDLLRDYKVEK
jgi:hypothetical protein